MSASPEISSCVAPRAQPTTKWNGLTKAEARALIHSELYPGTERYPPHPRTKSAARIPSSESVVAVASPFSRATRKPSGHNSPKPKRVPSSNANSAPAPLPPDPSAAPPLHATVRNQPPLPYNRAREHAEADATLSRSGGPARGDTWSGDFEALLRVAGNGEVQA
ncbi:hypothetical protein K438DRAFT_1984366 [Mycena galopus ATCC 62051]|nr:hypothetical protein K438DRAFT_1984366 [Mycena galopus ATCC 62051]